MLDRILNKAYRKYYIIAIVICMIAVIIIFRYINKKKVVTFTVSEDITSLCLWDDKLIGLTKDGNLIEYDQTGKERKTNQTNIRYICPNGRLIIKNDGTIITDLDKTTYEGKVIGKIPGAISGDTTKSFDLIFIVTENGELYYHDGDSKMITFQYTEPIEGWKRVEYYKNVKKAAINDSGLSLFIINGEVYSTWDIINTKSSINKVSKNYIITDIVVSVYSALFLDEQGNVYELYQSMRTDDSFYQPQKVEQINNAAKVYAVGGQRAVITKDNKVYLWKKERIHEGKELKYEYYYGEISNTEWDDILLDGHDYFYAIKDNKVSKIPMTNYCKSSKIRW